MATRKRTGRGAAGGAKGAFASVLMIVLVAAVVVGWWNVNGFTSLGDAIQWLRDKSDQMDACVDSNIPDGEAAGNIRNLIGAYDCNTPGPGPGEILNRLDDRTSKEELLAVIAALPVKSEESVNYKRSEWRHWSDLDKNGCDSREDLLVASGVNVKTDPKTCKVLSGSWTEVYSNTTTTDSSSLDVDHVVPLAWAARNGGNIWLADKKEQFANDPVNLVLASASENRSKSDKGPADYLPPNTAFQCEYAKRFVTVLVNYELTIPQPDKAKLTEVVKSRC